CQRQDRQGAWACGATIDSAERRRGDRMIKRREFIAGLGGASEMLRKKVALMQTVIGIGPISAMVVLAYLPDIGQLTKGQAARLAGLAPINNDSGKNNSCRNRHCPTCQGAAAREWLAEREAELLPVPY